MPWKASGSKSCPTCKRSFKPSRKDARYCCNARRQKPIEKSAGSFSSIQSRQPLPIKRFRLIDVFAVAVIDTDATEPIRRIDVLIGALSGDREVFDDFIAQVFVHQAKAGGRKFGFGARRQAAVVAAGDCLHTW